MRRASLSLLSLALSLALCVMLASCVVVKQETTTTSTTVDTVVGRPSDGATQGVIFVEMNIKSTAFENDAAIPQLYTCQGQNTSPPLSIHGVPPGAKSLALIMDDPDAPMGTWVHWVVWNIPATAKEFPEGKAPLGAVEGLNSWPRKGYGGPCPPSGTHRYFFKLYALDRVLSLTPSADKVELETAMKGHILGQAQLVGLYKKT